jgi:hypothetical protein
MENLTTEQYAVLIADSITNGQRKQAIEQFKRALAESVNADSLCEDIRAQGIESGRIFNLLCALVQEGK